MPREFSVEKLSDEYSQYVLILRCLSCLRERRTTPNMIAHMLRVGRPARGCCPPHEVLHVWREAVLGAGGAGHGATRGHWIARGTPPLLRDILRAYTVTDHRVTSYG